MQRKGEKDEKGEKGGEVENAFPRAVIPYTDVCDTKRAHIFDMIGVRSLPSL